MYMSLALAIFGVVQQGRVDAVDALAFARDHLPKNACVGLLLGSCVRPGMSHEQVRAILGRPMGRDSFGPPGQGVVVYDYFWYGICVSFDEKGHVLPTGVSLPRLLANK